MGYLFIAAALGITQDFCNKKYAVKFGSFKNSNYLLISIGMLVACICRVVVGSITILPLNMFIMAAVQSVVTLAMSIPIIKALNNGPIVGVNLILQCMSYISVAYGIIRYGDEVKPLAVIAAIIFLVVLLLLSPPKEEKKSNNAKWFIYAIIAGALSALNSCIQKTVSEIGNNDYMEGYVLWQTFFVSVAAFVAFFVTKPYNQKEFLNRITEEKMSTLTIILLYGLCGGFIAFMQLKALSMISALIVYPTLWGLSLIITPIISLVYFHDLKLTPRNALAIVLGLIATLLNTFA